LHGLEEVPNLRPITIGDGSRLFVGQYVLAIGNPFGVGNADGMTSASLGVISNIGRRAEPLLPRLARSNNESNPENQRVQSLQYWGSLIQADCRLNMGVSGGALINTRGELVGITMALAAHVGLETPGGFALPTDDLTRRIIDALRQGKEMEYGFMGIRPQNITAAQAKEQRCLPVDGVRVEEVNGPAARGGLLKDDIVVGINGQPVRTSSELVLRVGSLTAGAELHLDVVRGTRKAEVRMKLGKYPIVGEIIATNRRPTWNGIRFDYLSVLTLGRPDIDFPRFGGGESVRPRTGVAVIDVATGSPADLQGVSKQSVITAVNGKAVDDPDDFEKAVANVNGPVRLTISNEGREREYVLPPPSGASKPLKRLNEN
jgi:S1-C subfamily serine protease